MTLNMVFSFGFTIDLVHNDMQAVLAIETYTARIYSGGSNYRI